MAGGGRLGAWWGGKRVSEGNEREGEVRTLGGSSPPSVIAADVSEKRLG